MWTAIQEWWPGLFAESHANEWISGLTGICGAIIGGIITLLWTEWFNRRTRRRDNKERVRTGTFSMFHRLNKVYSFAIFVRKHLREAKEVSGKRSVPFVCLNAVPIISHREILHFTIEELWTLTQLHCPALINQVAGLDEKFNTLHETMREYGERRGPALVGITPIKMEGEIGTLELRSDQLRALTPAFTELDSI